MSKPIIAPKIAPDQGVLVAPQVGVTQSSLEERLFKYPSPSPTKAPIAKPITYTIASSLRGETVVATYLILCKRASIKSLLRGSSLLDSLPSIKQILNIYTY